MTDTYLPTTEEVRNIWRASSGYEREADREFDRWLAAHDRDTWNAGFSVGYTTPLNADLTTIRNPHQEATDA